jgi:AraC-like DNA-binding protein
MDAYGALLTDKQREFMRLHYEEDLSFGEIAQEFGVSRQAIHDAVKHAERTLDDYEQRLGLVQRERRAGGDESEPGASAESADSLNGAPGKAADVLEGTLKRLRGAGVIYSADWIMADLRRALSLLHGEVEHEEGAA